MKHQIKRIALLILADLLVFAGSAALAQWFAQGDLAFTAPQLWWLLANVVFAGAVFTLAGLYSMPMRMAGIGEAVRVICAMLTLSVFNIVYGFFMRPARLVQNVLMLLIWLNAMLVVRFSLRLWQSITFALNNKSKYTRVMVVGGGSAGGMLIREMQTSGKMKFWPVCVIDDDPAKYHTRVHGVPVLGTRKDIVALAARYNVKRIFIAMPSTPPAVVKEISEICVSTGLRVQVLPAVHQMLEGSVVMSRMRDVSINDLLGRDPIVVDNSAILASLTDRVVLVTGGGGSIGSELCRQIAAHNPRRLVIFDIYENNAYDIQQELLRTYPGLNLEVFIGSVREKARVRAIFEREHPQIVFHAAAHKHVPLMEVSPHEAIKNNVFGTLNVAQAADEFAAERFVLISTDKAVNPTNVMGATKRICEMIVQDLARRSEHTDFVAVRFGNVLGSNGSVIPLFKRQIEAGGPVTVTHKDIIRYFMTIPEAVSLVLQAGASAKGGEIFVLDMGKPVKILDLAENLIRLSGYKPYEEINIEFTGLRPGEKLYEELLMSEEGLTTTDNHMIFIGKPIDIDHDFLYQSLDALRVAMYEKEDIRPHIRALVSTYHDAEQA